MRDEDHLPGGPPASADRNQRGPGNDETKSSGLDPRLDAPFLVRIAGLPAREMATFHTSLEGDHLVALDEIQDRLSATRAELSDAIGAAVPAVEPARRRVLLALRRDCFNGRSLRRAATSPAWRELCARPIGAGPTTDPGVPPDPLAAVTALAERAIACEDQLERAQRQFEEAYERERRRERVALADLASQPAFARALALASPALVDNLRNLKVGTSKQQADLEAGLLRYASRAALKTSPFSTLTRVGLGLVSDDVGERVRLVGDCWLEHSTLRFKRFIADQYVAALARHPSFRASLRVALNSSLWEKKPGLFCFLRPGFWREHEGAMQYTGAALVQVALGGPVVAWLRRSRSPASTGGAQQPTRPASDRTGSTDELDPAYDELVRRLAADLGPAGSVTDDLRAAVARLVEIGFLRLLPPWSTIDGRVEPRLLDHLRALPPHAGVSRAIGHLERLVSLEGGYARSRDPRALVRELEVELEGLWACARDLGNLAPATRRHRPTSIALYEDVFVTDERATGSPWREVARADRGSVASLAAAGALLGRLGALLQPRQEFLHALAAFAARRWPSRREVGAVELIRDVQPLWRAYGEHVDRWSAASRSARFAMVFDPFQLGEVAALAALRRSVWENLKAGIEERADEEVLSPAVLARALAPVPSRYAPALSPCLLVQPLARTGREGPGWVLNHLVEGTGRMGSRYTPVIPDDLRARYTTHLAHRSWFDGSIGAGSARVALLDVACSSGDTLNLHAVQTPAVLELPDEWLDLPAQRKVGLGDLRVQFGERLRVIGPGDREFAPVHLGLADESFMPPTVRLLTLLGPGGPPAIALPRNARPHGAGRVWPRMRMGDLVLRRRRWELPVDGALRAAASLPPQEAFRAIRRWRTRVDLPERLFVMEEIQAGARGTVHKPQYIDFSSPAFAILFSRMIRRGGKSVSVDELLPDTESAPGDRSGERWVVELQLDALAWRDPAGEEPPPSNGSITAG